MTLDQIRIFLTVAELGHVTRAALRLNLTQSAVSAAIAALERQHDVQLFDRVGRGIRLTEAGEALVVAGQRVQREAEDARALLADFSREPRGRLRIWASQTIASYWLTPRLIEMHRIWPKVELSLHDANTADVARAVTEGAADLGLVEGEAATGALRTREVGYDELLLVLPRAHPLARQPRLAAQDYRAMQWLVREPGSGTRAAMESHLATMGLTMSDLAVVLQLPTNEAILGGIRGGRPVSMLSWRSMQMTQRRHFALRRVTWAEKPRRKFLALTDPRRAETRAVQGFLDLIAAGSPPRRA